VFLADGRPRVTGYGVAAAVQAAARAVPETSPAAPGVGQEASDAGRVPDPRLFIAPELASGDAIGPAGDMFSLGAVVAFAAGGKGPFGIGGPAGSPYHAPYGVPDLGGVPAALRPLITRCLDADPGWRPTAGEFRALATALLPDAAEPAQWPEVEVSDPALVVEGRGPATASPSPAPAAVPPPAPGQALSAAAPLPASQSPSARHSPPAPVPAVVGTRQARPMRPRPMHQARPVPMITRPGTSSHSKRAIMVACAIVVLIVVVVGLANTGSAPQLPAPGAQQLYYSDYQTGDCLYGSYPNRGGGTWPSMAWQVPCGQSHSDEVFFASLTYWPAGAAYPGTQAVQDQGYAACESQFTRYVGVYPVDSVYNWTYVAPYPASDWQAGDRELACIAYKWMPGHSNGVPMKGSIRGSAQ
jgi:hypothetical protein